MTGNKSQLYLVERLTSAMLYTDKNQTVISGYISKLKAMIIKVYKYEFYKIYLYLQKFKKAGAFFEK